MFTEEQIKAYMEWTGFDRDQAIQALTMTAAAGGVISSSKGEVYLGTGNVPTTQAIRGKVVTTGTKKGALVKSVDESYNLFWTDPKTQSQVLAYQNAIGRASQGEVGAYELWKSVVDTASEAYSSGKGAKVTPYQLISMSIAAAKKEEQDKYKPQINVYNVPDEELSADIDEVSLTRLGAVLSDEEKAKFLPLVKDLMQKGVRTDTSVGPKGAVITETTPRFTRELGKKVVAEAIEAAPEYKTDIERKQRVDFMSALNQWRRGR